MEKVRNIKSKVGVETQVVVQNENTKVILEQPKTHDAI
jgi:hypothetical protein